MYIDGRSIPFVMVLENDDFKPTIFQSFTGLKIPIAWKPSRETLHFQSTFVGRGGIKTLRGEPISRKTIT